MNVLKGQGSVCILTEQQHRKIRFNRKISIESCAHAIFDHSVFSFPAERGAFLRVNESTDGEKVPVLKTLQAASSVKLQHLSLKGLDNK